MILFKDFHWLDASDIRTSSERRPKGKNLELHSLVYRYLVQWNHSLITIVLEHGKTILEDVNC